jgi:glycosyltransferase involved in cell wall biosynthesis
MTEPTVSVIIPVYNGERYVREAIESVFAQTFAGWELIVIDDGSVDRSRDIIRGYGDRLTFVEQDNHGVCHARNAAVARARGRYVAFLDSDDIWHPSKLDRQVAFLEGHGDVGLVHSDLTIIDDRGRAVGTQPCSGHHRSAFSRQFLGGHLIYPSAAMIRTDVFRTAGGFSEDFLGASYEDIEFWVRLSARCRFHCIREPLVFYRIHAANNTKNRERSLRNRGVFLEKVWAAHAADHRRFLRGEFAKFYSDVGKFLVERGNVSEGRASLRRAIAISGMEAPHPKTLLRACLRLGRSYLHASAVPVTANRGG